MDWNAMGALAESVGAIGVILSLLYVAHEIRSNTKTLRADAGTQAQLEWSRFNQLISAHPDRDTLVKFFDPNEAIENFSDKEMTAITFMMRSFVQQMEAQFFQYQAHLLDDEVWKARVLGFRGLLEFPVVAKWWGGEMNLPIYTRSFVDYIEAADRVSIPFEVTLGPGRQRGN